MRFADAIEWLEHTALAIFIRDSTLLFPLIEVVHILGFVILVGSAFLFDLRLLGIGKYIPLTDAANYLLPAARKSLIMVVPSGFLLFISQAQALSTNAVFGVKLLLIVLAIANAAIFHRFTYPSASAWSVSSTPIAAKVAALISLVLWTSVITCGRLIAYF